MAYSISTTHALGSSTIEAAMDSAANFRWCFEADAMAMSTDAHMWVERYKKKNALGDLLKTKKLRKGKIRGAGNVVVIQTGRKRGDRGDAGRNGVGGAFVGDGNGERDGVNSAVIGLNASDICNVLALGAKLVRDGGQGGGGACAEIGRLWWSSGGDDVNGLYDKFVKVRGRYSRFDASKDAKLVDGVEEVDGETSWDVG